MYNLKYCLLLLNYNIFHNFFGQSWLEMEVGNRNRIDVSEYQIEGAISVYFSHAARATRGRSGDCNRSESQKFSPLLFFQILATGNR